MTLAGCPKPRVAKSNAESAKNYRLRKRLGLHPNCRVVIALDTETISQPVAEYFSLQGREAGWQMPSWWPVPAKERRKRLDRLLVVPGRLLNGWPLERLSPQALERLLERLRANIALGWWITRDPDECADEYTPHLLDRDPRAGVLESDEESEEEDKVRRDFVTVGDARYALTGPRCNGAVAIHRIGPQLGQAVILTLAALDTDTQDEAAPAASSGIRKDHRTAPTPARSPGTGRIYAKRRKRAPKPDNYFPQFLKGRTCIELERPITLNEWREWDAKASSAPTEAPPAAPEKLSGGGWIALGDWASLVPAPDADPLAQALDVLNDRQRRVFVARRLADEPMSLEDLAAELGVTGQRVAQLERRAIEKVEKTLKAAGAEPAPVSA
jgi:DNA-directed RNA polymerase specialized sigma24 family protein